MTSSSSKHLVIGLGEVGKALLEILREKLDAQGIDQELPPEVEPFSDYQFLHICFPYSKDFIKFVNFYKGVWLDKGGLVIIHSTVPEGTTEQIEDAVHSPIRGKHPHLVASIKRFVKFVGGPRYTEAMAVFDRLGIKSTGTLNPRNTEALKLWDTLQYGLNILIEKEIFKYCEEHGLDFDLIYSVANGTYNEGYRKLNLPEFKKYILKHIPGPIGGHCVIENARMLDHDLARDLIAANRNLV